MIKPVTENPRIGIIKGTKVFHLRTSVKNQVLQDQTKSYPLLNAKKVLCVKIFYVVPWEKITTYFEKDKESQ